MLTHSRVISRIGHVALRCAAAIVWFGCAVDTSQPQESKISSALGRPGAVLMRLGPAEIYTEGVDFNLPAPIVPGNVVAGVTAVAFATANSGCLPAQFAGFPAGNIALVRRGTCEFETKVLNATAAGASGVIIANSIPGLTNITVGDATGIPSLFITQELGIALAAETDLRVHMLVLRPQ